MAGRTHEERRGLAERQECRGRHVEHQPAVAEESEGQAIETTEGLGVARATPKPFKAMVPAAFKPMFGM
jgi:hypothetical protein